MEKPEEMLYQYLGKVITLPEEGYENTWRIMTILE